MQNSKKQRKRKLNNQGLSLVELLVAVVILAMVTGPLLHSFVSAAIYNQRAKERQRTTTAAQSVMEGFKAYGLAELCWQFDGHKSAEELAAHPFRVYSGATGSSSGSYIAEVDGVREFVPTADNTYEFFMRNIAFEGMLYDAKINLSPASGIVRVPSVEDMNGYLDAVYKQSALQDATAYAEILNKVLEELKLRDNVYDYELEHLKKDRIFVYKKTTVNISTSGGVSTVTVSSRYVYKVTDYPYYYNDESVELTFSLDDSSVYYVDSPAVTVYDNTGTVGEGAELENIYLYYYPAYSSGSAGVKIAGETIEIQNNSGAPKNVYLIKQKNTAISDTQLNTCENSYTPSVSGVAGSLAGTIHLFHNLDRNLSGIGSGVGAFSISGMAEVETDMFSEKEEILLYNVTVFIYAKKEDGTDADLTDGAAEPLLTLTGTMND